MENKKIEDMLKMLFLGDKEVNEIVSLVRSEDQNKAGIDYLTQALNAGKYRLHEHRKTFATMIYNDLSEGQMKDMCDAVITSQLENAVNLGLTGDAKEYASALGRNLTREEIKTMGFHKLYNPLNAHCVESGMNLLRSVDALDEVDMGRIIKRSEAMYGGFDLDIADDHDGASNALIKALLELPTYEETKK